MNNKKTINILCWFIMLQPIYDASIYLLNDVLGITLAVTSIIRPLLAAILFLFICFDNNKNKVRKSVYFVYLCIYGLYSIAHLLHIRGYFFELSYAGLGNEIRYLANYGYYLLLLVNLDLLFRVASKEERKKIIKSFVYAAFVLVSLYFVAVMTNTSPHTYSATSIKKGWKGWSVSSHYMGHALTLLTPIVIYAIFEKKYIYNKFRYLLFLAVIIPSLYIIGTKTPLFAIIVFVVSYAVFRIFYDIMENRKVSKDGTFFAIISVLIILSLPYTYGFANFDNQLSVANGNSDKASALILDNLSASETMLYLLEHIEDYDFDINEDSFGTRFILALYDNINMSQSVFDNRVTQKAINSSLTKYNSICDHLLGYGFNTLPNCLWVETDTWSIFYSFGWLGLLLIILIPYSIVAIYGLLCIFNIKKMNVSKFLLGIAFALSFYMITEVGYTMHFAQTVVYLVALLIISLYEFKSTNEELPTRKYLFAINDLTVGGAEVGLVDVINELSKTETVDLVLLRKQGPLLEKLNDGINVYSVIDSQKSNLRNKCYRVLYFMGGPFTQYVYDRTIKGKYEVEVSYLEGFPAVFIASSSNPDSVKIASIRVGLKNHTTKASRVPLGNFNVGQAYKKMDRIYTVSEQTTEEFVEIYPKLADKTSTIYTYFNVEAMTHKGKEKMEFEFDKDTIDFLAVGRFAEQKGYDRLVEAFEGIVKNHSNARLHFIGDFNTDYGNKIMESIVSKGLEGVVKIHGVMGNPYPYIQNCDCLISSSHYEGYPRVINEALALGKLCIGTSVVGTIEALRNGELGLLVDDSVQGLISGMERVLTEEVIYNEFSEKIEQFDGNKTTFFNGLDELSKKKKKMIIYMPKLSFGGMEKALVNLINYGELNKEYDITIYFIYMGVMNYQKDLPDNVKVIIAAPKQWNIYGKILASIKLAFRHVYHIFVKYDISVSYSYQHPILCRITRMASSNNIVYIHNNLEQLYDVKKLNDKLKRCKYEKFHKIICVSEDGKEVIQRRLNRTENLYAVNNLIDGDKVIEKSKDKVDDFNFEEGKKYFINVCRHVESHKKLSRIINTVNELNKEIVDYEVILIGDGEDHGMYQDMIRGLGITNIHILGKKPNPYKYIARSDAFLLSSVSEGYPVVFVESMTLNIPIVTTDVSDARMDIHNKRGYVCENDDKDLYNVMKQFLEDGFDIKDKFDYKEFNQEIREITSKIYNGSL